MILHIPHASTHIPEGTRDALLLDDKSLTLEILKMTDHYTDELFTTEMAHGDEAVIAEVSRLVVDVERFEEDAQEPMAQRGMGAIYTSTSDLSPLRSQPTREEREQLLSRYYRPHHKRLRQVVDERLASCGYALVLDCHSFPSQPLPYEMSQSGDRPEICIGTDEFHTPPSLAAGLVGHFESKGYEVRLNTPFSGSLVPSNSFRRDSRVSSVMVEVNRALYLNEATGDRSKTYTLTRSDIAEAVSFASHLARRYAWS